MNKLTYKLKFIKYSYLLLFSTIIIYLLYITLFQARTISSNSFNRRLRGNDANIIRGSIIDRDEKVIAQSYKSKKKIKREYIHGREFSHVLGYWTENYGSAGLEALYNKDLMSNDKTLQVLKSKASGEYLKGNNIKLTIDDDLQVYSSNLLKGRKGSIVVLNPKTGEILAMVNKPDYNPSNIQMQWQDISKDKNSPLLNRATEGLYPPGSIFKIIDTASIIEKNMQNEIINCTGKVNIEGYEIKDSNNEIHKKISLEDAFSKSCNSYFINMGLKLGGENLYNEASKFLFNKRIASDINIKQSVFPKQADNKKLAGSSIGQGDVLITPIHAALLASTIANDGVLMQPYVVDSIMGMDGKIIKKYKPKQIGKIIENQYAEQIQDLMIRTVKKGTGYRARISNISVAGKTGTAENPHGNSHAWFIGFAPSDNPRVAIAVLIENGGSGGKVAAPIAAKVMKKTLNIIK